MLIKDLAGNVIRRNFTQDYWVTGGPKPETYISPDGMQKTPAFEGMVNNSCRFNECTLCWFR